jgi:hypothetical protein
VYPQRKFEILRLVFEILFSSFKVWATRRVAWRAAAAHHPRSVVARFAKGSASQFGLIRRFISLVPRCTIGVIVFFAAALGACLLARLLACRVYRFGISLVQQIGCELLAQSLCRQRRLLRGRTSPAEIGAGPLSLPGVSVPPTL